MSRRRLASICGVLVLGLPAGAAYGAQSGGPGPFVAPATSAASTTTSIPVSGTAPGRTFGGVGAISAGANTRYLIDYPEPARGAILDHLFKPNDGAALQVLKVEVGGDADSTDGAEASAEHTQGAVDCGAGYEWWLMEQAKARNPAIKLYALAWTAPGWTGTFWSQNTIAYLLDWLSCARGHGLTIDYLGGNQNETPYRKAWTESLRAALDSAGFTATKLVMADTFDPSANWSIAADLAGDSAFRAVTGVIGEHDVCGYPTNGNQCTTTATARGLGTPLWASELGAMDGNAGAASMARATIRGYSQARLVGYLTWPLISAMPPGLPHETFGLLYAKQPWSGNYQVNAMTYAIAMTSWFTAPGWRYVNGANGGFGGVYANGSYTTLRAPSGGDWSTIAETTTTTAEQFASFTVSGGLAAATVHVWRTKPGSTDPADWMVRRSDIQPVNGRFSFGLLPGYIYTFSTLARAAKGAATPPPARAFGAYADRPDANPLDETPVYLAPIDGAFEHRPCATDPAATCTQQTAPRPPVYWRSHAGFPYAVLGDESLRDYTVSSDVLFTQPGSSAGVLDRFSDRAANGAASNFRGYILRLGDDGGWQLLKNSASAGVSVLKSGKLAAPAGVGSWHTLSLAVVGTALTARIDGQPVASAADADAHYATGIAGIEAGATQSGGAWTGTSWPVVQYRNLTVTP
jgi:O-glycosyl hydrolase